ncbi:MAG: primosomal protein N' [Fimbriimonadaceae bacterium]
MAVSDAIQTLTVADVVIEARSGGGQAIYTYASEPGLGRGSAVLVPLANRSVLGFVLRERTVHPDDLGFRPSLLRKPDAVVEGLALEAPLMDLVDFVAEQCLCPLPVAISAAVPPGLRDRLSSAWVLIREPDDDLLTPLQREAVRTIRDAGGTIVQRKGKQQEAGSEKALKLLRAKGIVRQVLQLMPQPDGREEPDLLRLVQDADRVEKFLREDGRKKPAQALTVMRLQEAFDARLTAAEIKGLSGVTDSTVKALLSGGLLEVVQAETPALKLPPNPNPYQQIAIDAIVESVRAQQPKPFLLFGVTGSGKTEVYLRAASEALRLGRQVLYLVPEIALATQVIAQLRERFGRSVAILHSNLKPSERIDSWMRIRSGEAPLVLGARSALFSPLTNLGLIVMDEEHEGSYKQESSPRYHAKGLARFLAERHSCPVVLGSATPSVESFFEAEQGGLELLSLPKRVSNAELPSVHIDDLTEGYRSGKPGILGEQLRERMGVALSKGEQVILFLNRRSYSPFLICRDCGHPFACPHCAVSLAYSKRERRMRCHHCGYQTPPPDACPECQGVRLNPFGVGTEKVEEAVGEAFPEATVARLDRDIAQKRGALEEVLAAFRSGDTHVLVGTQMVAKGLDFPNVTLVGVIAADVSLNIPDFRASERTFQLLSQVGGRAGRGQSPGHVVIQTFNPLHPAVIAAKEHAFLPFFEAIKKERQDAGYPPFRRLVNIVISGENRSSVFNLSNEAGAALSGIPEIEVLGPADCAIERLQARWRRHVLVKLPPGSSVAPIGERLGGIIAKDVQVVIDVDPYSLI